MQQMLKKTNEKIKSVSPGFIILSYLMIQQRMQKMHFLNIGHTKKSQIAITTQASWHNNITTLKYSILQQIKNQLHVQFAKTLKKKLTLRCCTCVKIFLLIMLNIIFSTQMLQNHAKNFFL